MAHLHLHSASQMQKVTQVRKLKGTSYSFMVAPGVFLGQVDAAPWWCDWGLLSAQAG
ncbi:hypothetical protein PC119_g17485 [Phytophthora cactorum]|nr:hypothetical protein PC119_g17485 [Phytophthora cactorum]KAG4047653.1 hypothetical protein PC123_g16993 [Phytophthora cactorum]